MKLLSEQLYKQMLVAADAAALMTAPQDSPVQEKSERKKRAKLAYGRSSW